MNLKAAQLGQRSAVQRTLRDLEHNTNLLVAKTHFSLQNEAMQVTRSGEKLHT